MWMTVTNALAYCNKVIILRYKVSWFKPDGKVIETCNQNKGSRGGSTVVDHSTHDREEEGSNPDSCKPVTGEDRGESIKN